MTLEETLAQIKPLDKNAMDVAAKRWDSIAKPLHSLGKMEKLVIQIAGITGNPDMKIQKRALVPMCADNGVVEEGVTQTGQEVTAIVAENFLSGDTSACVMSRQCGTKVIPVDIGMTVDTRVSTDLKVACGTANMTKEPAVFEVEDVPEMARLMQPILQFNVSWICENGKMKVQMLGFGYLAAEY